MGTITEGKEYLKRHYEKGTKCPCCDQTVKLYIINLNRNMVKGLIMLYKIAKRPYNFIHTPTEFTKQGVNYADCELSKLAYWGFVNEEVNTYKDKKCSGRFAITEDGIKFINNKITAPKHALIYNSKLQGFSQVKTSVFNAINDKFNYYELMNETIK